MNCPTCKAEMEYQPREAGGDIGEEFPPCFWCHQCEEHHAAYDERTHDCRGKLEAPGFIEQSDRVLELCGDFPVLDIEPFDELTGPME